MIKLTDAQSTLVRKLLAKLAERSTITAGLTAILGAMGVSSQDLIAQVAGYISIGATVLLALINDKTLAALLKGSAPAPHEPAMEPDPVTMPVPSAPEFEATPMSLLSSVAGVLLHVNPIVSAAVQAVTLVEALFPDSAGAAKLQAAQAYVAKAAGTAEDVTSTIEGVLAALKAQGVISSGGAKAQAP